MTDLCIALNPKLTRAEQLTALLHDAPEYVIGDMISPFKSILGESYKAVEQRLEVAIHLRFGLPATCSESLKKTIKRADRMCAWFEAVQLAGFAPSEANKIFGKPPERISLTLNPQNIPTAQESFLKRFSALYTPSSTET